VLTQPQALTAYKPIAHVKIDREFNDGSMLLILPRYELFRDAMVQLAQQGVGFREIAGNQHILMTLVAPAAWTYTGAGAQALFSRPILTHPDQKRVALNVSVPQLTRVVSSLKDQGIAIEHIYDY
jgi:hypothetical protein